MLRAVFDDFVNCGHELRILFCLPPRSVFGRAANLLCDAWLVSRINDEVIRLRHDSSVNRGDVATRERKLQHFDFDADKREELRQHLYDRLIATRQVFSHKNRKMPSIRGPQTLPCPIVESTEAMISITCAEHDFDCIIRIEVSPVRENVTTPTTILVLTQLSMHN